MIFFCEGHISLCCCWVKLSWLTVCWKSTIYLSCWLAADCLLLFQLMSSWLVQEVVWRNSVDVISSCNASNSMDLCCHKQILQFRWFEEMGASCLVFQYSGPCPISGSLHFEVYTLLVKFQLFQWLHKSRPYCRHCFCISETFQLTQGSFHKS